MNACTATEIQRLIEVYAFAHSAVTEASQKTPSNDPARWDNWFSVAATQAQRNHVATILADIRQKTLSSGILCLRPENAGTSAFDGCNQIFVRAFVRRGTPVINICPGFFELNFKWQVNAFIHEAAHLSLNEPDFMPSTAKTFNGGVQQAIDLANENLSLALRNASNFAHFATNDPTM